MEDNCGYNKQFGLNTHVIVRHWKIRFAQGEQGSAQHHLSCLTLQSLSKGPRPVFFDLNLVQSWIMDTLMYTDNTFTMFIG